MHYPFNKQLPLTLQNLDRVMNELRIVVLDANHTEDQSTENLAAVLDIFQRIVNETVVLDNQVSPSPYLPCSTIDYLAAQDSRNVLYIA